MKGLKHDLKQLLDCISAFLHAAFHPHLMISDDADVIEMQTKVTKHTHEAFMELDCDDLFINSRLSVTLRLWQRVRLVYSIC